ncbi:MAG: TraM recognition domain-containing protein [Caulobacteraceae bacterium]|nr:TraM recognition domain-containing protein [Caulobacteraceae bacterium]
MLGRMDFFETMMGAMAGYGIKALLVCQSPNHIARAYGRDNVIIDNCGVVTSFSAADGDPPERIADMAGEVWEVRESETQKKPRPILGWGQGSTTLREERRPLLLPADVRALPRDELIFVSGCKPIRAKKIRFDEECIFRERLRPATGVRVSLTTAHDWTDVRPLGFLEASAKPSPKRKAPSAGQSDLFAQPGPKLSDLALAGFRTADGARMTPPPNQPLSPPPAASADAAPSRKARWTGV